MILFTDFLDAKEQAPIQLDSKLFNPFLKFFELYVKRSINNETP